MQVYSSVHFRNSFVHNLLFRAIRACGEQGKGELLNQISIIPFVLKSATEDRYAFMSLRGRIFRYWVEHELTGALEEEERKAIEEHCNGYKTKLQNTKFYKDYIPSPSPNELSATKMPSEQPTTAFVT